MWYLTHIYSFRYRLAALLMLCVFLTGHASILALSAGQRRIYQENIAYFDLDTCQPSNNSSDSSSDSSASTGDLKPGVEFKDSDSGDTSRQTTWETDGVGQTHGDGNHLSGTTFSNGGHPLNSDEIHFFALNTGWQKAHKIEGLDVAAITYKGKTIYAVFGDTHSSDDSVHAEISYKASADLRGSSSADNLTGAHFTVYPGSHKDIGSSFDQAKINEAGRKWSGGAAPSDGDSSSTQNTSGASGCCDTGDQTDQTASLDGNSNLQKIFNFFVQNNYSKEQAAGIVGNVVAESSGSPERYQGDEKDHKSPPKASLGWGIVQWTPASKLVEYASSAKKPAYELETQLEYLLAQLEGKTDSEKAAGDALKQAKTAEEAATTFQNEYERPASRTASLPKRVAAAKAALKKYGDGVQTATDSSASQPDNGGSSVNSCACTTTTGGTSDGALSELLGKVAKDNGGQTKVSVSTIDGKHKADASGDDQMPTRSSYKLYTAYATLRAIEDGKISWSTRVWGGRSVEDTMKEMIIKSNNDAAEALRTNHTIGTPAAVTKMLQSDLGLSGKTVMGDGSANDPAGSNSKSTANDFTKFLILLYKHKLSGVKKDANYDRLIDLMKHATTDGEKARQGIVAGAGNSEVADKPGWASGNVDPASNDAGIVYLKDNPYVVSILTDAPDKWDGVAAIARRVDESMRQIKGSSGDSTAGNNASSGDFCSAGSGDVAGLMATIQKYAWPDYSNPRLDPKPEYKKAFDAAVSKGQYPGGGVTDCGAFVTRAMIDSGYEPEYNSSGRGGNTLVQRDWLKAHWKKVSFSTTKDLHPGDVAISDSHTYMYIGKVDGMHGDSASASLGGRTPMASTAYEGFEWYRKGS